MGVLLGEVGQEGDEDGGGAETAVLKENGFLSWCIRRCWWLGGEQLKGTEGSGDVMPRDVWWEGDWLMSCG